MADRKISDLTALTTPAAGDYLPIVDISEAAAASKNKRITVEELMRGAPDGTAGAPGFAFESDPNTGIYSPGADQVAISTGGTGRLFIDASGRVGINSAPSLWLLEVKQDSASSAGGAYPVIQVNNPNANGYAGVYLNDSTAQAGLETQRNTGHLGLQAGGSERLRITSAGLVGIGSSSPLNPLVVSNGGANGFEVSPATNSGTTSYLLSYNRSTSAYTDMRLDASAFRFEVNATERMRLTSTGLGIGTTSPGGKLVISDGTTTFQFDPVSGTGNILRSLTSGGSRDSLLFDASQYVYSNGATEYARIDSSGRLLVGTSSARANYFNSTATTQLQIEKAGGGGGVSVISDSVGDDPAILILGKSNNASVGGNTAVAVDNFLGTVSFQGNDGSEFVDAARISCYVDGTPGANDMPGRLVFSTTADGASSPTERMRITNKGAALFYASTANVVGAASNEAAGTAYYTLYGSYGATSTTTGTTSFLVFTNGNVQNTNNSYAGISDVKLKENIVDAGSQWADLKALQVRKYNFKEGQTHTQIGLVAQEVELVSPGLVTESPDRDAEGNDLGTVTKSVNYSVLYMKAVKALQEAMERIETLEARLTAAGL